MHNSTQRNILELLKRSQRILVLPSSPPDGDSLGSAIALYMVLKRLDKEVTVICTDPVPEVYDFLPNINIIGNKISSSHDFIITLDCRKVKMEKIHHAIENDKVNIIITPHEGGRFSEKDISFNKGDIAYDLIITVDTAELSQLRGIYEQNIEMFQRIPVVNIDHHVSNTHFGRINYVDIMSSSTTELLLPLFENLARESEKELIDEDIATLLLTGIITDTGSFQNANTTPRSFEVASQLISYGARQQEIIQYIYKTKQLSQLKLWGRVLSKIQTDEKHRVVWSVVSQQDFLDTGSSEDETGDIIDELMTNAPGAEVILLMKEKKDHTISVSIRTTTPSADAAKIAETFGGGGHTQAAGFRLSGVDLREGEYQVIQSVKKYQSERLQLTEPSETAAGSEVAGTFAEASSKEKTVMDKPDIQLAVEEKESSKKEKSNSQIPEKKAPTEEPPEEKPTFKPKSPFDEAIPEENSHEEPKSTYKFED